MAAYPAIIHRDTNGTWWAQLVDFPEATTGGGSRRDMGREVPRPSIITIAEAGAA